MKLTIIEKLVIGTNIFLLLVLLTLLGLQFAIDKSEIDIRQLLRPSPAATSAPTKSLENKINLTIEVPEPTTEEEIGAKQPRRALMGWAVIIISSLLMLGGLIAKFIRR